MPTATPPDGLRWFGADIVKAVPGENGTCMVFGRVGGPTLDNDYQILDKDWLDTELPKWGERGNIRAMHQLIAAGKMQTLVDTGDQWDMVAKIVDPVEVTKCLEGVYTGFSVGIKHHVVKADPLAPGGRIVGGKIIEVSLADNPCDPANKLSLLDKVDMPDDEIVKAATLDLPMFGPDLEKFVSADQRKAYAKKGIAMPNGDFPIADEAHLKAAVRLLSRYKGDKSAAKAHIVKRARALGMTDKLPDDFGGSSKVTKATLDKAAKPKVDPDEDKDDADDDDDGDDDAEGRANGKAKGDGKKPKAARKVSEVSRDLLRAIVEHEANQAGEPFDLLKVTGLYAELAEASTAPEEGDARKIVEVAAEMATNIVPSLAKTGQPIGVTAVAAHTFAGAADFLRNTLSQWSAPVPADQAPDASKVGEPDAIDQAIDRMLLKAAVIDSRQNPAPTPLPTAGLGDMLTKLDAVTKAVQPDTLKATLSEVVKPLEERVAEMEKRAAPGGPMLGGQKLLSAPDSVKASLARQRLAQYEALLEHPDPRVSAGARQTLEESGYFNNNQ